VEIQSNVREELAISGNQETHTNEGEIQNVYTNVDHSNRDNDFVRIRGNNLTKLFL
jgi:hypothetical protein